MGEGGRKGSLAALDDGEALAIGGINETVARQRLAECEAHLSGEPTETAH